MIDYEKLKIACEFIKNMIENNHKYFSFDITFMNNVKLSIEFKLTYFGKFNANLPQQYITNDIDLLIERLKELTND